VLPIFTWLFPLFPLFTSKQQKDLNHFFYTCLKRVFRCRYWADHFFAYLSNEKSLDDRCLNYWNKFFLTMAESTDGELILEQACLNVHRETWLQKENRVTGVFRSKRFVEHSSILEKCLSWCSSITPQDSIPDYSIDEIMVLTDFPDSF
jgi:hypothetical protein